MWRRTAITAVLTLAMLAPALQFLCTDCLGCPSQAAMAPASCHDETAPVLAADCCARLAAADRSAPAPATNPGAGPAAAGADPSRPVVSAGVAPTTRLSIPPPSGGVSLFTLHSALLI